MSDHHLSDETPSGRQMPMDLIMTSNGNGDISALLDNQHIGRQVMEKHLLLT
jgi:hypothetical protein